MFTIKIERNTRQWLGTLAVGGVIAGMIFVGLIPAAEYQKYAGFVVGAFFYHIVRMLNGPGHIPDTGKMVESAGPDQFRDATKMISPATPPQATQESPQ